MSHARRASHRDLRDPGRGDPGFRRCCVDCFSGHLRKILLCGLVMFLCFCARSRNSLAHKLLAPLELSLSVLFSLGFVGFGFVVLLCFVFLVLFFGLTRLRTA